MNTWNIQECLYCVMTDHKDLHEHLPQNDKLINVPPCGLVSHARLVIVNTWSGVPGFPSLTVSHMLGGGGLLCELHCPGFPTCHRLAFSYSLIWSFSVSLHDFNGLTQGCALRQIEGSSILGTREIYKNKVIFPCSFKSKTKTPVASRCCYSTL